VLTAIKAAFFAKNMDTDWEKDQWYDKSSFRNISPTEAVTLASQNKNLCSCGRENTDWLLI